MKNKLFTFLLAILFYQTNAQHLIIPEPVSYETINEVFVIDNQVNINIKTNDIKIKKYTEQFQLFLNDIGIEVSKSNKKNKTIVVTRYKKPKTELGKEGYTLEVNENNIKLAANDAAGIFNGFQTLKQLFPLEVKASSNQAKIIGCKITDYPRFKWRGLMLDV